MNLRIGFLIFGACLSAGCQSIEGTYRPGCIAYEGDEIRLTGGEYAWDRFTDQVSVDADGKVLDAFPDFPRYGTYEVDGERVLLEAAGGSSPQLFFLLRDDGKLRLLNERQRDTYERSGKLDPCALLRDDASSD